MTDEHSPTMPQRDSIPAIDDRSEVSVLVVDDEEQVADLYTSVLSERYDATTAYGGQAALAELDETYDVVLLDRRMPDMSGDEVLTEIRRRNLDCRVAMVTAVDPDLDIVDMPFDDYVCKPVSNEALHDLVRRLQMLSEYKELRLERSSKAVKRNVLEAELTRPELADSEEFARLEGRIRELDAALAAIEGELDEMYLAAPNV